MARRSALEMTISMARDGQSLRDAGAFVDALVVARLESYLLDDFADKVGHVQRPVSASRSVQASWPVIAMPSSSSPSG